MSTTIHLPELEKRVKLKLISKRKHPTEDLYIYNYTDECTYKQNNWDYYTRIARGLILDAQGCIVARPFKKFFNINECQETSENSLPDEIPEVSEKLDGSLGILYPINGRYDVATRGSFDSWQAQWATEFLHKEHPDIYERLSPDITYLVEIIYPDNRIVVDYQGAESLVLIGMVDNDSGYEFPYLEVSDRARELGLSRVPTYNYLLEDCMKFLSEKRGTEFEGFVLYYPSKGLRLKIVGDNYRSVFRILVRTSQKEIWRRMSMGESLPDLDSLPVNAAKLISNSVNNFQIEFRNKKLEMMDLFKSCSKFSSRKKQAEYFKSITNEPWKLYCLFMLLDNRPIDNIIWKQLEPSGLQKNNIILEEEV